MAAIGSTILSGLVALLLIGALALPYFGGAVVAYVLIGLSLLLIAWNFARPPLLPPDIGSWMFVGGWSLIAIAFAITNLPGRTDYLLSINFGMFALFPLLVVALQRFARPGNLLVVAALALGGSVLALVTAALQVFLWGYDRAEGYASNPIASSTIGLLLGFFSLAGLFGVSSKWRLVLLLGPLAGTGTVLLAGSRGPLLALPVLVAIGLLLVPVKRSYSLGLLALLASAAGAAYAVKPTAFRRFAAIPDIIWDLLTNRPVDQLLDPSGSTRYAILEASLTAFARSPWLGYGWYMKIPVVEKYLGSNVGFGDPQVSHLHSDILDFAVSGGIIGLAGYALAIFAPIVSAISSVQDSQFKARLYLSLCLSLGYACCGAINMLFGFEFLTTMYVVLAAIFIGYCRDGSTKQVPNHFATMMAF